ncbi:MAG: PH domain-containing protein [Legionella sp.]|nr:MAG: PH domain-containing protein [Legionella sp.]
MTESAQDSNIVYFAKLHWIIFFWPVLALGACLTLGIYFNQLQHPIFLIFSGFSLLWVFMTWVIYHFSSLTIQRKRVIIRTGVIVRQTVDVALNKIETMDIRQSILGSIFQYGTLIIIGTGGSRQLINFLQRPLTCRRYIEQLMNEQQ